MDKEPTEEEFFAFLKQLDEMDKADASEYSSPESRKIRSSQAKQNVARAQSEIDDEENRPFKDKATSFLLGFGKGGAGSWSDEIGSVLSHLPGAETKTPEEYASMQTMAEETDPGAFIAGDVGGQAAQLLALSRAGFGATKAGGLPAAFAKTGAAVGGVMGLGQGEGSDRLLNAAQGAGTGALVGGALGKGGQLLGRAASAGLEKLGYKPSLKSKFGGGPVEFNKVEAPPPPAPLSPLEEMRQSIARAPQGVIPTRPPVKPPVSESPATIFDDATSPNVNDTVPFRDVTEPLLPNPAPSAQEQLSQFSRELSQPGTPRVPVRPIPTSPEPSAPPRVEDPNNIYRLKQNTSPESIAAEQQRLQEITNRQAAAPENPSQFVDDFNPEPLPVDPWERDIGALQGKAKPDTELMESSLFGGKSYPTTPGGIPPPAQEPIPTLGGFNNVRAKPAADGFENIRGGKTLKEAPGAPPPKSEPPVDVEAETIGNRGFENVRGGKPVKDAPGRPDPVSVSLEQMKSEIIKSKGPSPELDKALKDLEKRIAEIDSKPPAADYLEVNGKPQPKQAKGRDKGEARKAAGEPPKKRPKKMRPTFNPKK